LDGATNEFDTGSMGNPSTRYGWYKQIDTTNFGDGPLTVTLTATDEAEKVNTEVLNLTVDQSTDLPQIIFDNMDASGSATDNAFAGSPSLIGRVVDDDGVDPASIEVRIDSSAEVDWTAVGGTTGSGLSVSWEQSIAGLAEAPTRLNSGRKIFTVPIHFRPPTGSIFQMYRLFLTSGLPRS